MSQDGFSSETVAVVMAATIGALVTELVMTKAVDPDRLKDRFAKWLDVAQFESSAKWSATDRALHEEVSKLLSSIVDEAKEKQ